MTEDFSLLFENIEDELRRSPQPVTKIDVAINVYGKPYNTAATLYSLLKYSGQWIDKIYFIEERKQPKKENFSFLKRALSSRIICYIPKVWLSWVPINFSFLYKIGRFRNSIRYQYAWENTNKDYLFITHNDVLYQSDIIGSMLQKVGSNIGIGQVGQCWNCSAFFAGLCRPEKFLEYRPSYAEAEKLFAKFPGKRLASTQKMLKPGRSWPLPECRLNEWSALINLKVAKPITIPLGSATPFGAFYGVDIGVKWFNDVHAKGYTVAHFPLEGYASHAWSSLSNNGHAALSNAAEYEYSEEMAKDYLQEALNQKQNTVLKEEKG